MIRLEYRHFHPEKGQVNTELAPMRAYEKMVSMWDGHGEAVKDPNDIIPAIRRAVANGKPSIINVEVDHESMSPFIGGYSAMVRADK
jgi:thiamine pyrophosphate-dependent acetolactate synthase large subunit-like protein